MTGTVSTDSITITLHRETLGVEKAGGKEPERKAGQARAEATSLPSPGVRMGLSLQPAATVVKQR